MSEKIIILHPENQPEVDIYPIIKEGSIPNSVIDNQKIKSRTIINSNIALNTLKYEVLHQTLKDLIDSKITQVNMQNYLSSYYYNVEETQQYVGSEINTLHQTIQNEFYSKTTIDDMLMEKTDLSLFRQYLPSTYLDLTKQQDNQTSKLNLHANGSIFLANSGNKTNSGNYYLPNSIVKTEDAPNGYYVLSTTNDDYQSLYNLGAYDKITTNSDGTYTITRQTGYLVLDGVNEEGTTITKNNDNTTYRYTFNIVNGYGMNGGVISNLLSSVLFENLSSGSFGIAMYSSTRCSICINGLTTIEQYKTYLANNNLYIQYKLATSYTEKVEKNHYATYNQTFILEHNKSEAERSANLTYATSIKSTSFIYDNCITLAPFDYKNGITYHLSFNTENTSCNLYLNNHSDLGINYMGVIADGTRKTFTFTPTKDVLNYTLRVSKNVDDGKPTGTCSNVMLNIGSTPLPYQPYEGKTIHEKELESAKNEINNSKQDKLVSNTNIKTINGNSILGSGDMAITADSVFTKVENNVTSLTISKNETYLITTIETYIIHAVENENINFYGSALVTTTGMLGGNPHININGVSYPLSNNTVTLISDGLFKAYKLNY